MKLLLVLLICICMVGCISPQQGVDTGGGAKAEVSIVIEIHAHHDSKVEVLIEQAPESQSSQENNAESNATSDGTISPEIEIPLIP